MGIKMNGKKLGLLFGLVGVFTGIYAGDDSSCKKDCNEKKMQDCSPLCFAGPQLEDSYSFEVMGAAIYGVASVQGSEIALNSASRTDFNLPQNAQGVEPTEQTSWGFKVGAGFKFNHDDWKIVGRYNWFKANYDGSYSQNYGGGFFPTMYANAAADYPGSTPFGNIASFQNLDYDTNTLIQYLNVYLIRPTLYTALLEISPYFGVDYINTTRKLTIMFTNDNPQAGTTDQYYTNGGYFRTYDKNQFWGVGPMAGVYSNWYLGYDFGIFADAYFGVTYGNARSYSQTVGYRPSQPASATPLSSVASIYNSLYQYAPHMDLQLGLSWSHTFEESCAAASFKVAYESAYYFQTYKTIINSVNYGVVNGAGIGLQNLVLQGQIDF
jgi:hypothetical protein